MSRLTKIENIVRTCAPGCVVRVDTQAEAEHARKVIAQHNLKVSVVVQPWTVADSIALAEETAEDIRCGRL